LKKKRICVYCQKWESGGIESFLYNVLSRLDMAVFDVDLVVERMSESVFTQPLLACGVHFLELSGTVRDIRGNSREFRRLLCERAYDVVWLNVYQGLALRYLRLAKRAGIEVRIAHSHNTALRPSAARWIKLWLHRWARARYTKDATHIWACSGAAAKFMYGRAGKGARFIPNGIKTQRFAFDGAVRERVRAELGLTGNFVIGNVGRLCYQKNQAFVLDIFARVARKKPDSCLLLVGEGEDLPALQDQARQTGILEKVVFYGVSDRVEQLLWAMDAFVFPSRFEGLGIVAVEAQAAGLPVVCSEHVPQEAFVTSDIRSMSLDSGAQAWADALLNCASQEREKAHETVRQAGFDIAQVTTEVARVLKGD